MGAILTPAIDAIRKIDAPAADAAHAALLGALAAKALRLPADVAQRPEFDVAGQHASTGLQMAHSYRTWHGPNGGECPNTLDTLPVFLKYELTVDRCGSEIAEVIEVCISGHVLSAGNFDVSLCAEWGRQCMQLRGGL